MLKKLNILFIASSDMDGTDDGYNLPSNVHNLQFPCNKYKHIEKSKSSNIIASKNSDRCDNCKYTEIEHKYDYPLYPLHSEKILIGEKYGKPFYKDSEYSDLWINKQVIFERVKLLFGENIEIMYHTLTPAYKNDISYLPTINKINSIIQKNLNIKGNITYQEPYHFSCYLDKLHSQPEYKNYEYDCIFIISGGPGWLYTPENFKIMHKLLPKDKANPGIIGNLWYIPDIDKPEYYGKFKFINPINSCLHLDFGSYRFQKKAINTCIKDYSKIILGDKYAEVFGMLARKAKQPTKTRKSIKHSKSTKKSKL